jgi:hypothetical protein
MDRDGTAAEPRKTPKSKEQHKARRPRSEIKYPDRGAWKYLVRDLKLTEQQANELGIAIQHVILDLEPYVAHQAEKPELVARLKSLETAFRRLQLELNRSVHRMDKFLPDKMLEAIGKSLTFTAMTQALGTDVFPAKTDNDIRRLISGRMTISMAHLEARYAPQRETLGLKYGHLILKHHIESLWAPLKNWVEQDKLNKGGRPPDVVRNFLIDRLAEVSPSIIGKAASISTSGKFVELCLRVLPACGLSSDGVEKTVVSVVRKRRTRLRPGKSS